MGKSRDAAKERYWRGVIRRLEASGLGVRRFCQREGLAEHRLHWRRRSLRKRDQGGARPPRKRGACGSHMAPKLIRAEKATGSSPQKAQKHGARGERPALR